VPNCCFLDQFSYANSCHYRVHIYCLSCLPSFAMISVRCRRSASLCRRCRALFVLRTVTGHDRTKVVRSSVHCRKSADDALQQCGHCPARAAFTIRCCLSYVHKIRSQMVQVKIRSHVARGARLLCPFGAGWEGNDKIFPPFATTRFGAVHANHPVQLFSTIFLPRTIIATLYNPTNPI